MSNDLKPDWQTEDSSIRLYCGDCLEILPHLSGVDAIITDPPYGIDFGRGGGFSASHGWGPWREQVEWDVERPPKEAFDALLRFAVPTAIWGGNYFTDHLPPSSKWLVWDKGQTNFSLADVEVAWCLWPGAMRRLLYPRAKALRDGKVHPTQKPVAVIAWNIEQLPITQGTILDAYMGSGTTGVSCVRLGRKFIGIEREPKYFDSAIKRIQAELERAPLFDAPPKIVQKTICE